MGVKKTNVLLDEELVEAAKELTGTRFTSSFGRSGTRWTNS